MTRGATAALLMLAVACADVNPATDPDQLTGITWVLNAVSATALAAEAPLDARATITFEDGQAGGSAFCNSYGGSYEASADGSISFEAFAMTEMACAEPYMALEAAYLEALGEVTGFEATGDVLILSGGPVALAFAEEVPMDPLPLEGTQWRLDTITAGTDAVSSVVANTEPALLLNGGQASGDTGCNTFSGAYELDGASLTFGPLATTKMACSPDVMTQEAAILEAIGKVATWSVEEDRLTLADAEGTLLLGYTGAPA